MGAGAACIKYLYMVTRVSSVSCETVTLCLSPVACPCVVVFGLISVFAAAPGDRFVARDLWTRGQPLYARAAGRHLDTGALAAQGYG